MWNSRYQQSHCITCTHIKTGTTICSTTTGKTFRVKATADYCTKNVVYVIECTKCATQFIREIENTRKPCMAIDQIYTINERTDQWPDIAANRVTLSMI